MCTVKRWYHSMVIGLVSETGSHVGSGLLLKGPLLYLWLKR